MTVRVSGVDSVSLRKLKRLVTSAWSTGRLAPTWAGEKRTTVSVRISGRVTCGAISFMKAISWSSVGGAGAGTLEGSTGEVADVAVLEAEDGGECGVGARRAQAGRQARDGLLLGQLVTDQEVEAGGRQAGLGEFRFVGLLVELAGQLVEEAGVLLDLRGDQPVGRTDADLQQEFRERLARGDAVQHLLVQPVGGGELGGDRLFAAAARRGPCRRRTRA